MIPVLLAALLVQSPPAPESAEGYLAQGIRQVEEGDLETATLTLDTAIRRLGVQPDREAQLSEAHLYLGMAYLGLAQQEKAVAAVQLAWKYGPHRTLDRKRFPPTLIAMYEKAERESPPPSAAAAPSAAPEKKGHGKLPLVIVGVAVAAGGVALAAGGGGSDTGPPTTTDSRRTTPFTGTPAQLRPASGVPGDACSNREFVGAFSPGLAVGASGAVDVTVNFAAPAGGYRMVLCGYRGSGVNLVALRVTGGTNGCDMTGFPTIECVCAGPGPSVSASTSVDSATDVQWFLSFTCDGPAPSSPLAVPWSGTMRHP